MQTLENCHPKLILALEVVVGEEECSFVVKYHGKREKFPYCFSDPRNVTSQIYYELQVSILAAVNLWKTKNSLSK